MTNVFTDNSQAPEKVSLKKVLGTTLMEDIKMLLTTKLAN